MYVSVAVITYNSSKTIVETLNSILHQSYGANSIELIISDDASIDNTVLVIEEWLKEHKTYFHDVKFIKNSINLGVSGNINTAWKKASYEWIKSIGGDDLLDSRCIEHNINYVKQNPDCKILFSQMKMFGRINGIIPTPFDTRFFYKNSKEQYNWLRSFSFNIAPSAFINSNVLKEVNYSDEKYRMIEDLPLWIKITKSGYKLHFLNIVTVYYRMDESISTSSTRYANLPFIHNLISIYQQDPISFFDHPYLKWVTIEKITYYKMTILVSRLFNNQTSQATKIVNYLLWILRPVHLINKIFSISYNRYYEVKKKRKTC